jgi:predicted enzyme involved in methoxymalonyl-ACP biosynthesis
MVLKLEDISMFVANWEDKATNIKHIQQTLNIGIDSLVFLDDNPFERNLVRSMIPETYCAGIARRSSVLFGSHKTFKFV